MHWNSQHAQMITDFLLGFKPRYSGLWEHWCREIHLTAAWPLASKEQAKWHVDVSLESRRYSDISIQEGPRTTLVQSKAVF